MFGVYSSNCQPSQPCEENMWLPTQEEGEVCPFSTPFDSWPNMMRLKQIVDHVALFRDSCPHPHPPIWELVMNRADGTTPLLAACNNGNLRYVKYIVEAWGADVNAYGSCYRGREFMEGVTPLFIAAANAEDGIVDYLIEMGADLSLRALTSIRGVSRMTPFDAAKRFEDRARPFAYEETINSLFKGGCPSLIGAKEDQVSPFCSELDLMASPERLEQIVEHGDHDEDFCLYPHPPLSEFVKNGADGTTPLLDACSYGKLRYVKYLVEAWKADVNAYGSCYRGEEFMEGVTPLFIAAANGDESIVKYLIERGADVSLRALTSIRGVTGMTPLDAAKHFKDRNPLSAYDNTKWMLKNSNEVKLSALVDLSAPLREYVRILKRKNKKKCGELSPHSCKILECLSGRPAVEEPRLKPSCEYCEIVDYFYEKIQKRKRTRIRKQFIGNN